MGKDRVKDRPVRSKEKKRVDLRPKMNNQQRNAWAVSKGIIDNVLAIGGVRGAALAEYRILKEKNPSAAASIRDKSTWFRELLEVIGE